VSDPDPRDPATRPGSSGHGDVPRPLELDLAALKALAHPLRLRMYELLADRGAGTASQLAADLGESSGTTSYHLRVLAEHGLLVEDRERGDRRDRWWRVRAGGYQLDARRFREDPSAAPVLQAAAGRLWHQVAHQLETWYRTATSWDDAWIEASASTTVRLDATPAELAALRDEVVEVLVRHREHLEGRARPEAAARVAVQFHAFPLAQPGPAGPATSGEPAHV